MPTAEELVRALRALRGIEAPAAAPSSPLDALSAMEVDVAASAAGRITPTAGAMGTVYWLQGPAQSVELNDIKRITSALNRARASVEAGERAEAHRTRLSFAPEPCDTRGDDAPAKHGYRLARKLRERLGLGTAPITDLRALLAERLGVCVEPHRFAGRSTTAAAVLDHRRAAALILLDPSAAPIQKNARLLRVAMAHELCHLLFDPPQGHGVGLSLDLAAEQAAEAGTPRAPTEAQEALEKRARAFAAELLLPCEGLAALAAERTMASRGPQSHRERIAQAADRFDTPREIAFWHIKNTQHIDMDPSVLFTVDPPSTSPLPARIIGGAPKSAAPRPQSARGAWAQVEAWLGAPTSGSAAEGAAADATRARLGLLQARRDDGAPMTLATDVMLLVEDLVDNGQLGAVDLLVETFMPEAWPLEVGRGLLRQLLWLEPRPRGLTALRGRVEAALRAAPGWDEARVARFMARAQ
ncbi:MAG: ImmA/IrrE family metallo-endopeptidase [Deltaproteobacteria bacterium]|nr:ImmA/IrrE family metallo-endopeptidase [Deltaproteobacteria bacterium]